MQNPSFRNQPTHQGGQQHQHGKHAEVPPDLLAGGCREALRQSATAPAQGQQRHGHAELGGHQGPAQTPLEAGNGGGSSVTVLLQQLNPGRAQADQGKLGRREEGQQDQQGRRSQESHRQRVGVARIELA